MLFFIKQRGPGEAQTILSAVFVRHPLDDRRELDELDTFTLEEPVDTEGMVRRLPGNASHHVVVDPVLPQKLQSPHYPVEGAVPLMVTTIAVMDLFRTVETDPHHEVVLLQEVAPLVGEERSIGLKCVGDGLCPDERSLKLDDAFKEIDAQEGRLPALPDELDDRGGLRSDVVRDEAGQDLIGHPVFFARPEQRLFFQVETVLAVEVAQRPYGFCHHVDARLGAHVARFGLRVMRAHGTLYHIPHPRVKGVGENTVKKGQDLNRLLSLPLWPALSFCRRRRAWTHQASRPLSRACP
ncbi:MAG: hypothetical protein A4E60_03575 [Syntrophorhabdus sp. PtaB.Bin047]|nr:MAG: hypothetical protein A4E60_03575 [Syntrophorhabdus sp. PtaB.Bin047]